MKRRIIFRTFLFLIGIWSVSEGLSQDDLLLLLEAEMGQVNEPVVATFKGTRIINCHSIERMQMGDLDFRVGHRFGLMQNGWSEFFGLDESSSHVSIEYGLTNWLMAGVGRATVNKNFTSFIKLSPMRQTRGENPTMFSLSFLGSASMTAKDYPDPDYSVDRLHRMAYAFQILIASKLSDRVSVQLSPTWLHRNMVKVPTDPNRIKALGIGGRVKLTNRFALTGEYYLVDQKEMMSGPQRYNPLSIGFDIETGSHVFQLFASNTFSIAEADFLGETTRSWRKGEVHLGFNITRVFTLLK